MRKPSDKLYVIGNRGVSTVKIGIAADVPRRLAELANSACPWRVDPSRLVALRIYETPRARALEAALHASFAAQRLRRPGVISRARTGANENTTEWFRFGAGATFLIDGRVKQIFERWEVAA